jgi:hypothetical protein
MVLSKPITQQIIRPQECVLAFCVPLNYWSFKMNQLFSKKAGFTRYNYWRIYKKDTIQPSKEVFFHLEALGIQIKKQFKFRDFENFFVSPFKALILFAHWEGDGIEFYDGALSSTEILKAVPRNIEKIVDLNVCKCDLLAKMIIQQRDHILVKRLNDSLTYPLPWLFFYECFFTMLLEGQKTYLQALDDTRMAFEQKLFYQ